MSVCKIVHLTSLAKLYIALRSFFKIMYVKSSIEQSIGSKDELMWAAMPGSCLGEHSKLWGDI